MFIDIEMYLLLFYFRIEEISGGGDECLLIGI